MIEMLLWCPRCFEQHLDEANSKPHVVHVCIFCKHEWKATNSFSKGVISLSKTGSPTGMVPDHAAKPSCWASRKDFDDAVEYTTKHLQQTKEEQEDMVRRVIAEMLASQPKPTNWAQELGCPLILVGIGLMAFLIALAQYLLK
jgi:hypothetical protein